MKSLQSESVFRKRLDKPVGSISLRQAIAAMFDFYAEQRAEDVNIDHDGDMLLYSWGKYRCFGLDTFFVDITRQFIIADDNGEDDDEPYQLGLTLHFPPTDALRQLKSGDKWCESPDELAAFRQFVESSAPFKAVSDTIPSRVDLRFEQC